MLPLRSLCAALLLIAATPGPTRQARFFFAGDGVLDLGNAHFPEHLHVRYRDGDGRYDAEALAQIERFFRSRTDNRSGPLSLRLIELIDFVQDRYPSSRWVLISGYRSPNFNAALRGKGRRVAEASLHTEGLAADVQPSDGDLRRMWLDLRELQVGGVGLYRSEGFLHVDTGRPRFWEPATSGVEKHLSAGNARLFARTDFDRYADLRGAAITLHGVTMLPIRIAPHARLGDGELTLEPGAGTARDKDGCLTIEAAAPRYSVTIASPVTPPAQRAPIRLATCAPRVGATPAEIVTNDVERGAPQSTSLE